VSLPERGERASRPRPAREATRRHREWLHGLVRGLVEVAGVGDVDRISRAIVVLHDGAVSSALLDGDSRAAGAARFAMERLLDEARHAGSRAAARAGGAALPARPRAPLVCGHLDWPWHRVAAERDARSSSFRSHSKRMTQAWAPGRFPGCGRSASGTRTTMP
jgi:hypothetical protein